MNIGVLDSSVQQLTVEKELSDVLDDLSMQRCLDLGEEFPLALAPIVMAGVQAFPRFTGTN